MKIYSICVEKKVMLCGTSPTDKGSMAVYILKMRESLKV